MTAAAASSIEKSATPISPTRFSLDPSLWRAWGCCDAACDFLSEDPKGAPVDQDRLAERRSRMAAGLAAAGYDLGSTDDPLHLLPKAPTPDDGRFAEWLARRSIFVLPGSLCGAPGRFRISLAATDAMVDRSLPVFAHAFVVFSGLDA
jgi:hypothetical protein